MSFRNPLSGNPYDRKQTRDHDYPDIRTNYDISTIKDFFSKVIEGNVTNLEIFLYNNPISVNLLNDGDNALHTLLKTNLPLQQKVNMLKFLISRNANINAQDQMGNTPLHHVCKEYNPQLVHILLNNGANPLVANSLGITPFHLISRGTVSKCLNTKVKDMIEKPVAKHDKKAISELEKLTRKYFDELMKKYKMIPNAPPHEILNLIYWGKNKNGTGLIEDDTFNRIKDYFGHIHSMVRIQLENNPEFDELNQKFLQNVTRISSNIETNDEEKKMELIKERSDMFDKSLTILKKYDSKLFDPIDLKPTFDLGPEMPGLALIDSLAGYIQGEDVDKEFYELPTNYYDQSIMRVHGEPTFNQKLLEEQEENIQLLNETYENMMTTLNTIRETSGNGLLDYVNRIINIHYSVTNSYTIGAIVKLMSRLTKEPGPNRIISARDYYNDPSSTGNNHNIVKNNFIRKVDRDLSHKVAVPDMAIGVDDKWFPPDGESTHYRDHLHHFSSDLDTANPFNTLNLLADYYTVSAPGDTIIDNHPDVLFKYNNKVFENEPVDYNQEVNFRKEGSRGIENDEISIPLENMPDNMYIVLSTGDGDNEEFTVIRFLYASHTAPKLPPPQAGALRNKWDTTPEYNFPTQHIIYKFKNQKKIRNSTGLFDRAYRNINELPHLYYFDTEMLRTKVDGQDWPVFPGGPINLNDESRMKLWDESFIHHSIIKYNNLKFRYLDNGALTVDIEFLKKIKDQSKSSIYSVENVKKILFNNQPFGWDDAQYPIGTQRVRPRLALPAAAVLNASFNIEQLTTFHSIRNIPDLSPTELNQPLPLPHVAGPRPGIDGEYIYTIEPALAVLEAITRESSDIDKLIMSNIFNDDNDDNKKKIILKDDKIKQDIVLPNLNILHKTYARYFYVLKKIFDSKLNKREIMQTKDKIKTLFQQSSIPKYFIDHIDRLYEEIYNLDQLKDSIDKLEELWNNFYKNYNLILAAIKKHYNIKNIFRMWTMTEKDNYLQHVFYINQVYNIQNHDYLAESSEFLNVWTNLYFFNTGQLLSVLAAASSATSAGASAADIAADAAAAAEISNVKLLIPIDFDLITNDVDLLNYKEWKDKMEPIQAEPKHIKINRLGIKFQSSISKPYIFNPDKTTSVRIDDTHLSYHFSNYYKLIKGYDDKRQIDTKPIIDITNMPNYYFNSRYRILEEIILITHKFLIDADVIDDDDVANYIYDINQKIKNYIESNLGIISDERNIPLKLSIIGDLIDNMLIENVKKSVYNAINLVINKNITSVEEKKYLIDAPIDVSGKKFVLYEPGKAVELDMSVIDLNKDFNLNLGENSEYFSKILSKIDNYKADDLHKLSFAEILAEQPNIKKIKLGDKSESNIVQQTLYPSDFLSDIKNKENCTIYNKEIMKMLFPENKIIDINKKDIFGNSPLMYAINSQNYLSVKDLLEKNAKILGIKNNNKQDVLTFVIDKIMGICSYFNKSEYEKDNQEGVNLINDINNFYKDSFKEEIMNISDSQNLMQSYNRLIKTYLMIYNFYCYNSLFTTSKQVKTEINPIVDYFTNKPEGYLKVKSKVHTDEIKKINNEIKKLKKEKAIIGNNLKNLPKKSEIPDNYLYNYNEGIEFKKKRIDDITDKIYELSKNRDDIGNNINDMINDIYENMPYDLKDEINPSIIDIFPQIVKLFNSVYKKEVDNKDIYDSRPILKIFEDVINNKIDSHFFINHKTTKDLYYFCKKIKTANFKNKNKIEVYKKELKVIINLMKDSFFDPYISKFYQNKDINNEFNQICFTIDQVVGNIFMKLLDKIIVKYLRTVYNYNDKDGLPEDILIIITDNKEQILNKVYKYIQPDYNFDYKISVMGGKTDDKPYIYQPSELTKKMVISIGEFKLKDYEISNDNEEEWFEYIIDTIKSNPVEKFNDDTSVIKYLRKVIIPYFLSYYRLCIKKLITVKANYENFLHNQYYLINILDLLFEHLIEKDWQREN